MKSSATYYKKFKLNITTETTPISEILIVKVASKIIV
jgi:hypothetical protein